MQFPQPATAHTALFSPSEKGHILETQKSKGFATKSLSAALGLSQIETASKMLFTSLSEPKAKILRRYSGKSTSLNTAAWKGSEQMSA